MSMFIVTCDKCGAAYYCGVIGTTFYGGHDCPKLPKSPSDPTPRPHGSV